MQEVAVHIANWQETQTRLANQSAEERFFDDIGIATSKYVRNKVEEARKWQEAYYQEHNKNEYLVNLLKQNGITVPDFSKGIPSLIIKTNNKGKKKKTFIPLLQTNDVDGTLKKLHSKIDGHGGKDVAMVLRRAKEDTIITRFPTETEFKSEFTETTGEWRSISYYLNPNHPVDFSSVTI